MKLTVLGKDYDNDSKQKRKLSKRKKIEVSRISKQYVKVADLRTKITFVLSLYLRTEDLKLACQTQTRVRAAY
jgi:hypothetical protein